jgi:drug/metabolite transporter (DMT)-like permease
VNPGVMAALGAAILFGASTPFAKHLLQDVSPVMLAGVLYLGSGIGLALVRVIRDRGWSSSDVPRSEWPWLLGAIAAGGIAAPALLMMGLARTGAAEASLLLNFESVLTAVLAWLVFRENADRRIVFGMLLIVAGGLVLSWPSTVALAGGWLGPAAITAACLCWAIDNNLTRKVSASDALFIAASKGLAAGAANTCLALASGAAFPPAAQLGAALLVGFLGYGISLVLFVLALRNLGTARTGAYFGTAPFIGVAVAIVLFHEPVTLPLIAAAALMGAGVWIHLTERHEHQHTHEALAHEHSHTHDEHHQHEHGSGEDSGEPHTHLHRHAPITHMHPHYPDVHHRHRHD